MIIARELLPATFLARPNKYLVNVEIPGAGLVEAFLPDPGRLLELLIPNRQGWVVKVENPKRKTAHDFIAIEHEGLIVSIDTRVPNKYTRALLESNYLFPAGFDGIKAEFTYKQSRIDFMAWKGDARYLIEVKSVTLVEGGLASFPDAPTKRGTRHVRELIRAKDDGYHPWLVFVIQRPDADRFKPREITDPEFAAALHEAKEAGVGMKIFTSRTFIDAGMNLHMEPLSFVPADF